MSAKTDAAIDFPAAGIACPRCGAWVWAGDAEGVVRCHCGFVEDAAFVRELAFLRARVPGWAARLSQLEEHLVNPDTAPAPTPIATARTSATGAPGPRVSGAYGVLVTVGALLIAAGVLALTVVLWEAAGPLGQAALMATVAVLVAIAAIAIRQRIPATAKALAVIAVLVWLAFAVLTARSVVGLEVDDAGWTLALASTAAWTAPAGWRWRMAPWRLAAALTAPLAVTMGAVMAAQRADGAPALAVAATGLGLLAVALVWRTWGLPAAERQLATGTSAAAAFVVAVAAVAVSSEPSTFATLIGGLAVVSAACLLVPALRAVAPVLAGVALGLTAGLGWASAWPSAVLVSVVVVAVVVLRRPPLLFLAAPAAIVSWAVPAIAFYERQDEQTWWACVLVLAAAAIAVAVRTVIERQPLLLLASAAAGVPAVLWAIVLTADVESTGPWLETFTVPLALVLLAYGLLARWLRPGLTSLVSFGPAVAVALWPSAVVGLADEEPGRLYAVLVAAMVLLVIGLVVRLSGIVAPAIVALVIVSLRPLSLLVTWMPSWVTYTAAGALLLVIGARFEHVRSRAVSVRHWAHGYFR